MELKVDPKNVKPLKTLKQLRKRVYQRMLGVIKENMPFRRKDIIARALMFCKQNRDVLVIIADPSKDDIILSYKNQYSAVTLRHEMFGGTIKIKKDILKRVLNAKEAHTRDEEIAINNLMHLIKEFIFKLNEARSKDTTVADSQPEAGIEEKKDNV